MLLEPQSIFIKKNCDPQDNDYWKQNHVYKHKYSNYNEIGVFGVCMKYTYPPYF